MFEALVVQWMVLGLDNEFGLFYGENLHVSLFLKKVYCAANTTLAFD